MINLLPPDVKQNMSYARRNTVLIKWAILLLISIAGVIVIATAGFIYLRQSTASQETQLKQGQDELKAKKLEETQKHVQDLSNSIKLVTQVLSREILFSKLLKQIGSAIPANASLSGLNISKVEGGIDLTAIATDYNAATQVQVNLADPANKIFDKADIVSINCNSGAAVDPKYPCTVIIRAQFAKNNPFLFINTSKGT